MRAPAPAGTRTFKSVWITASWTGGRTGRPLNSRGIDPLAGTCLGRLCFSSSLTLENHPESDLTVDGNGFYVRNSCSTAPSDVAFCRTAGSGGGPSSIPICAVDPKGDAA